MAGLQIMSSTLKLSWQMVTLYMLMSRKTKVPLNCFIWCDYWLICSSDLFAALKGGGNNFGIVTQYTLKTVPIAEKVKHFASYQLQ
jgi:hypothetical protein